ncbi:MAG TPA: dephospho-CoA kinase [Burkholderiales bacterium]|jgi:dephospho-CoA kinase|nr:dephospho-CoA kinase [Burkholderiales bacterium]
MAFVVGLTGGIGSGKSAAAEAFGRLGAGVVDTDAIAHALSGPGGPAIAEIRRIFGPRFISESNAMDRDRMRELVFRDPAQKKRLEALLHPMIRAESERQIRDSTSPYVVHVVPLLVESPDYRKRVQRVLVVDCPESLQIERVRARSGLAPGQVEAIIKSQVSREKRLAAADDVIDNSGSFDALQQQVETLHEKYLSLASPAT